MKIVEKHDHKIILDVPTNKSDVLREIDVIEEILRIYGFSNIPVPGKMHISVAIEAGIGIHQMRRLISQFLASRGYVEAMNMSMTQPSYYRDVDIDREKWVTIHNTSNESLNLMRPEMVMPTLETIKRNINRKQRDIRLFEFGKSYLQSNNLPEETEHVVISLSGNVQRENWHSGNVNSVDFFLIKSEVEALLKRTGIHQWQVKHFEKADQFNYGLEYRTGTSLLVKFGQVSGKWLSQFDIDQPVYLADF